MFEATLKAAVKQIFDFDKVTYDAVSEDQEQEVLFIEVESSRNSIKDGLQTAKVTGKLRAFANSDKLPFGYFSKKIQEADVSLTYPFFFYEFEESSQGFRNIVERSLSFVYFFDSQYNPELGTISSIDLETIE